MDVRFSALGVDNVDTFSSLAEWLRQEPELRGTLRLESHPPSSDKLGSAMDVLSVALGAGGAASALATSLRAWFSQPRRADVHLRIELGDDRVIELDGKRVADVEGLVRALTVIAQRDEG